MRRKLYLGLIIICMFAAMTACAKPKNKNNTTKKATDNASTSTRNTIPEVTKATEPPTKAFVPTTIDIVMIGDMLLHENVHDSGKNTDGTYNYDHLFTYIKDDVKAADIALVNEEVILGGTELGLTGYPMFNGAFEVGDALYEAGFNVILQATNHTLDKGKTGVLNNINFWKTKHPDIAYLGINESKEEQDTKLYVFEKDGIKVSVLNYTYGTNGIPLPSDMPYIVNLMDETKVAADIKKAKESSDFVVVCPHWGTEYVYQPDSYQKQWADFFLKNGVDLVIGTHPHVIEPVEWLEDSTTGHKMLVYYSIGNYVSGQDQAGTMVGAMACVTLTNDENGDVYISDYGVVPLVTHKERGYKKLAVYKLKDYTDELVARNYICGQDGRFSVKFCKDLCKEVFGDLYTE